jgi:hypothetical protein
MAGALRPGHDGADVRHVHDPGLGQRGHRHAEPFRLADEPRDRGTDLGRPVPVINLRFHREPGPGGHGIGYPPAAENTAGQNAMRDVTEAIRPTDLEDLCLARVHGHVEPVLHPFDPRDARLGRRREQLLDFGSRDVAGADVANDAAVDKLGEFLDDHPDRRGRIGPVAHQQVYTVDAQTPKAAAHRLLDVPGAQVSGRIGQPDSRLGRDHDIARGTGSARQPCSDGPFAGAAGVAVGGVDHRYPGIEGGIEDGARLDRVDAETMQRWITAESAERRGANPDDRQPQPALPQRSRR